MEGLCAFAYQCKEHELYEQKYIEFVKYLHDYNATVSTTAVPTIKPTKLTRAPFKIGTLGSSLSDLE